MHSLLYSSNNWSLEATGNEEVQNEKCYLEVERVRNAHSDVITCVFAEKTKIYSAACDGTITIRDRTVMVVMA